jgi:hypothetical protein
VNATTPLPAITTKRCQLIGPIRGIDYQIRKSRIHQSLNVALQQGFLRNLDEWFRGHIGERSHSPPLPSRKNHREFHVALYQC